MFSWWYSWHRLRLGLESHDLREASSQLHGMGLPNLSHSPALMRKYKTCVIISLFCVNVSEKYLARFQLLCDESIKSIVSHLSPRAWWLGW